MTTEKWTDILSAQFGLALDQNEAKVWFRQMRESVPGWRHSTSEGDDPCKGKKAGEINAELCEAIKHVGAMPKTPRKRDEGGQAFAGKITVADVGLWVWIYRRDKKQVESVAVSDSRMIEAGKKAVSMSLKAGDRLGAASMAASGNNLACSGEIFTACFAGIGNRSFTPHETAQVGKHFYDVTGQWPSAVLEEIGRQLMEAQQ